MAIACITGPEFGVGQKAVPVQKFRLHISERFDEKIDIDEKKDIEYFEVPAHNELSEADNLYDFKMVRSNC